MVKTLTGTESIYPCRRAKNWRFNSWVGKIPWRRACNPLQYYCLENPMDRGAWWATVDGVAQSQTQLKHLAHSTCFCCSGHRLDP